MYIRSKEFDRINKQLFYRFNSKVERPGQFPFKALFCDIILHSSGHVYHALHKMADGTIPSFPRFEPHVDTGDVAVRWRKWVGKFRNLMVAMNIGNDARQKALLLHYVGDETTDIFEHAFGSGAL